MNALSLFAALFQCPALTQSVYLSRHFNFGERQKLQDSRSSANRHEGPECQTPPQRQWCMLQSVTVMDPDTARFSAVVHIFFYQIKTWHCVPSILFTGPISASESKWLWQRNISDQFRTWKQPAQCPQRHSWKRTSRTVSESDKNDKINVFEHMGNILRGINGNVFVIAIYF